MIIGGLQKSSLIDYPEKISAIIFTRGCNFRCKYCHNPELLTSGKSLYEKDDIIKFLKTRQGKLDGVVITGGEATLQTDLYDFIKQIKELGFCVKLDSNGTNPELLKKLIDDKLVDYIAMDIKAPLEKYSHIIGLDVDIEKIKRSIDILMTSNVDYEFRTTVLKSLLSIEDLKNIGKLIKGAKKYYLQKFVPTKIYDEKLLDEKNYTDEEFEEIAKSLKLDINFVDVR